jgi:vacuolar protein sorting-associated protein 13D
MTGTGMLEHEGSMVPRDPRKSSSSSKSFVLDTNVIAPQPGKYAPLTLRKPDNRRTSTQIWTFTEVGFV